GSPTDRPPASGRKSYCVGGNARKSFRVLSASRSHALRNISSSFVGMRHLLMKLKGPGAPHNDPPYYYQLRTVTSDGLTAGHGSHDQKRLGPRRDRIGQRGVRPFVGQILLAREEPHERSAPFGDVVADHPA